MSRCRKRIEEEQRAFIARVLETDEQELARLARQGYEGSGRGLVLWRDPAAGPCI